MPNIFLEQSSKMIFGRTFFEVKKTDFVGCILLRLVEGKLINELAGKTQSKKILQPCHQALPSGLCCLIRFYVFS